MKNLLLLMVFLTFSCQKTFVEKPLIVVPLENTTPVVTLEPIVVAPKVIPVLPKPYTPADMLKITKLRIASLTGFSPSQETRFRKIASNVELIINTIQFKAGVTNFTYNKIKKFVDTIDSNEDVFKKVTSKDWSLEYRLEAIKKIPMRPATIGYTYPHVTWIVINKNLFDSMDDEEIAANIAHEFGGHKLGRYNHSQKWNSARDYSVPYGIGSLVEQLYKEQIK